MGLTGLWATEHESKAANAIWVKKWRHGGMKEHAEDDLRF